MPKIGDIIQDSKGNILGVISEILWDRFAVKVRGGAVVNYEDIVVSGNDIDRVVEPEVEYLTMYKIT